MTVREPWFIPYEKPGRSGVVAQMSSLPGLSAESWALLALLENAQKSGLEVEDERP